MAFMRWDYSVQSIPLESGRLAVQEKDVLVLGEHEAAPGIVAVNIIEQEDKIEIPDWVKYQHEPNVLFGQVVASGWVCDEACGNKFACSKEHANVGDMVFFRRLPEYQYMLGQHTVIFDTTCRHCKEHARVWHAADVILARLDQVIIPKLAQPVGLEVIT